MHDFENQSGDVFEAIVFGYDAQQFRATAVNTRLLDIRAGPRFGIFLDSLNGASIKPYVAATGVMLAEAPYLGSVGGGVTMHFNWANMALDPYVEVRRMDYSNSNLYPLASGLDGTLSIFALQAGGQVKSVRWYARFAFYNSDDAFPWYSYDRYAFDLWIPCKFSSPWGGRSWTVTPSFSVSPWFYRQPDPVIAPFVTEHAFEWRVLTSRSRTNSDLACRCNTGL